MTTTRKLTAATAALALAGAGVAAAGDAPGVGAPHSSTAKTAPVSIPGTGIKKGDRLPKGARIVFRDVTLQGKQTAKLTLRAPAGKTIRALAPKEGIDIGFVVTTKGNYAGRKSVALRAYKNPKAGGEVTGRIYGLAR
jgi:hypothetical protein